MIHLIVGQCILDINQLNKCQKIKDINSFLLSKIQNNECLKKAINGHTTHMKWCGEYALNICFYSFWNGDIHFRSYLNLIWFLINLNWMTDGRWQMNLSLMLKKSKRDIEEEPSYYLTSINNIKWRQCFSWIEDGTPFEVYFT